MKILLAEDNIVNQKLALKMLTRLGYEVDLAVNGLEVLDALRNQHYDVVLMDIQMPQMDGISATRHICQEWSVETRPRIIAVTANSAIADKEECLEAGMDDYISKPVKMEKLAEVLEAYKLAQKTSEPEVEEIKTEVIDSEAWETLIEMVVDGTSEGIIEVIDSYLGDAPSLINQIKKAAREGDSAQLENAAHTLKSSSAILGALKINELCLEVEEIAKNGIVVETALVCKLEAEYKRVHDELSQLKIQYLQ